MTRFSFTGWCSLYKFLVYHQPMEKLSGSWAVLIGGCSILAAGVQGTAKLVSSAESVAFKTSYFFSFKLFRPIDSFRLGRNKRKCIFTRYGRRISEMTSRQFGFSYNRPLSSRVLFGCSKIFVFVLLKFLNSNQSWRSFQDDRLISCAVATAWATVCAVRTAGLTSRPGCKL